MVDRVPPVRRERTHGDREQARDLAGAERVLAEDLEHVREERDPRAEENETDEVERLAFSRREVRQVTMNEKKVR